MDDGEQLLLDTKAALSKESKPCHLYLFAHVIIVTKDSKHVADKQQVGPSTLPSTLFL